MVTERNLSGGRDARNAGIEAVDENTSYAWRNSYRTLMESRFAQFPVGGCFIGEDLRTAAKQMGLSEPHHPNAWGANASYCLRHWLKEGRIVLDGMRQAKLVSSHARAYPRYRKVKA